MLKLWLCESYNKLWKIFKKRQRSQKANPGSHCKAQNYGLNVSPQKFVCCNPNEDVAFERRWSHEGWRHHEWTVCVQLLSCVQLFMTMWTAVHQAPLSMEFFRQKYCSALPFPSPGDLPDPEIDPASPTLQADSLPSEPPGKPRMMYVSV